jgi:hypothetical protein
MKPTKFALLAIFSTFYFNCSVLAAGGSYRLGSSTNFGIQDTLLSKTFESENDFSYFIAEEFGLKENREQVNQQKIDSLFQIFNKDKKILIPKKDLIDFLGYSIEAPVAKEIASQSVSIDSKSKEYRLELEVMEGDFFKLNYTVLNGIIQRIGSAGYVEVLLNDVRVAQSLARKRGKLVELEFLAPESGKIEIVIRNMGPLPEKGNLQVFVTPRKERINLKRISNKVLVKELEETLVQDTIFQTIVDQQVVLDQGANLKGSAFFQQKIEFSPDQEILGFSVFFYPFSEKENLQIFRRETYREDAVEDFSVKELAGKSFTYLPEFSIPFLTYTLTDDYKNVLWSSNGVSSPTNWGISPNSKGNYAFFKAKDNLANTFILVRFSNTSELYDLDFGLKIITLSVKKFKITQELDVERFEETILLSLL